MVAIPHRPELAGVRNLSYSTSTLNDFGVGKTGIMIIKGLFRRYAKWNPVHPTTGALWGMGVGAGCGIGWGPGFGPEVIGYVGAGCGVGFCVGITFAGLGIGLPANDLFNVPLKALTYGRTNPGSLGSSVIGEGWGVLAPVVSLFQRETVGRISAFNDRGHEIVDLQHKLVTGTNSVIKDLSALRDRVFQSKGKGWD